jgi:hypothetical protein
MPREKTNIDLGYTQRKDWVTKENIDRMFQVTDILRNIRKSQVKNLVGALEEKSGFPPMTVNLKGSKFRMIDGNHRLIAMKQYLDKHPDHKIEVVLSIYTDLTEDQEKEVYNNLANTARQTTSDLIRQNEGDIPIYTMIRRSFPLPITTYKSADSMSFQTLISGYLGARSPHFQGGYMNTPLKFLEESKSLTNEDYKILRAFCLDWREAFVSVKNNPFSRVTPFGVMMRIWLDNKRQISQEKMVRFFKTRLANSFPARDVLRQSGRGAGIFIWNLYLELLNQGDRNRDIFTRQDVISSENGEESEEE